LTDSVGRTERWIWAVLLLCIAPNFPAFSGSGTFEKFMGRLESLPSGKRQALVDSFWTSRNPLPFTEDSVAYFLFRSDTARSVTVAGDFNRWNPAGDSLKRIPDTDLFVLTKPFEKDARLDYKLVIDKNTWILDPRNPDTCAGGFGPNSELAMPEYLQPAEIIDGPGVPRGRLDTLSFNSVLLKNERRVLVYLPPSYSRDAKRTFPCVVVNDGGEYCTLGFMCSVLDNLIHEGKITEIVAVLIDPVNRNAEYWLDEAYVAAVAEELVPWIDSRYRTVRNPGGRGVMGASLGGLAALNAARRYPGVFGLCASQSGAFWIENEKIVTLVREAPISGARVYLDWGSYEPSIPATNARMADILRSKGCAVETRVWHEGHSWGSWRAHLGKLFEFLFPSGASGP
jgi:enterochelin esterase-like enzyme